ncbi:hypothetical protein HK105_207789 [Polyrhizophydium stewartii]|uniref:C2H2-type domain-containing protein n=1 Tax=Polyrhizophydium stewartii TaxID=2732419 RepID=A0ABR4MZH2_9FUNG
MHWVAHRPDAIAHPSHFAQHHALLCAGVPTVVVPDSLPTDSLPTDSLCADLLAAAVLHTDSPAAAPQAIAGPMPPSPLFECGPFMSLLGTMSPPISPMAAAAFDAAAPAAGPSSPQTPASVRDGRPCARAAGAAPACPQRDFGDSSDSSGPSSIDAAEPPARSNQSPDQAREMHSSESDEDGSCSGDSDAGSDSDALSDDGSCFGDSRPHHTRRAAPRAAQGQSVAAAQAAASAGAATALKPLRRGTRVAADPSNYRFPCSLCDRAFTRKYNLEAHLLVHQDLKPFACGHAGCTESFVRKYDLRRHVRTVHEGTVYGPCLGCRRVYSRVDSFRKHVKACSASKEAAKAAAEAAEADAEHAARAAR